MCPPIYFPNFNQAQFDALAARAKQAGLSLTGNSGRQLHEGVMVQWNYDPDREMLTVQVLSKTLLYPCGAVNKKLSELIIGSDANGT